MTSVAVHQYTYQHVGPWTQHADPSRGLFGTHRTSVAVHQYTYQHVGPWTQHAGPSTQHAGPSCGLTSVAVCGCPSAHIGRPRLSVCVRVCPSAHTGRPWVSVSTHRTFVCVWQHTQDVCGCPCVSVITHRTSVAVHQYIYQHVDPWSQHASPSRGLFRTSVAVRQYTQDVRGCPCVSVSTHRTSVAVHQYTYQHAGPWTQHAGPWTQHAGPSRGLRGTLTLPVDCSGDFGPRGLSFQYTQDIHRCPSAHTGRPCLSVSTHRMSVCVRQHTQDVRVCPSAHTGRPCVSVSTYRTSVAVHQYTYQHAGPWTQHAGPSHGLSGTLALPVDCLGDFGPRGLSVQYTQDVRRCPPAHTGRPWLFVAVRQNTQDVRGCPSAHTGRSCVSGSTHRTSVAVRVCPSEHTGHPWLSISTYISTLILGLSTLALPVDCFGDFGTHGLSVQYTQDVRGCQPAHTGHPWLSVSTHRTSVAVRVCPSAHTGRLWLSISTHISMLVLGLSTLALPVDCAGDFGTRGLSFQYTQDVSRCLSAHTGRPCVSVSTHRTSVAVHQYTYQHVGPWTQHADPSRGLFGTPALPVDCSGYFGPHGLSFQYTQDVRRCPSTHTGRPCVSVSTHRTSVCVRQHTQDVRGCPSVHIPAIHTGRPWVSVSTYRTSVCVRQHTQDVHVCPFVSVSTHMTSVAVHQYTYQHVGPWTQHADPSRGLFGTHRTSVAVHQYTYQHVGPWTQHAGPSTQHAGPSCGLTSVAVCGCPSAHIGRPRLSVTHRTSVAVRVCPSEHTGRPWLSISTYISTLILGLSMLALPVDCFGDFGIRGLSVQYTQDVSGCQPAHTGHPWLSVSTHRTSVAVRVCPSAHTGRLWLSISTHISMLVLGLSTLVLGLSTLALPVDCAGDFGTCGLSLQYAQDVRRCLSAHTGRPCVSVSTHRTTLALPVKCSGDFGPRGLTVKYTQDVRGCPLAHTGHSCVSVSTHRTSVAVRVCPFVSVSTHRTSVAVDQYTYQHYTQDVRRCPPAHTGRSWLSLAVHQHTQDVCGCPWVSVSTHKTFVCVWQHTQNVCGCLCVSVRTHMTSVAVHQYIFSTLILGLSTLALPVDCFGDFGKRGLSVQYTQDVRGCQPAHTGHPWLSVCTHRTSVAVRVCPSAHTGRPWLSISTHISMLVLGLSTLALLMDCAGDFGPRGLSFQYTQDVRGCPSVHISARWSLDSARWPFSWTVRVILAHVGCLFSTQRTSVAVHQYTYQHVGPWTQHADPSPHTGRPWLSISAHISTLVLGLSTLALHVDCLGDFGTRGLSVQYTQDVRGCQPAHTVHPWVSVSTHRTFVCVRQHTQDIRGCPTLTLPMDCLGDFGPRGLSVQYTQDIRRCPPAHTGRPWLSVAVRQHTQDVCGCPWVSVSTHRTFVCVWQHTQNVCGCLCVSVRTHMMSVAVHQYIFSTLILGLSTLALPVDCFGDFGTRGLSVQYTQDVRGCQPAHTGHPWLSVCTHRTSVAVCVCPSAHTGLPWLSISTHISMLVLGLSTLALLVDCASDFGPRGLSFQYTQDVRGCPSVHISARWTSVGVRQHTHDVCGYPCLSVCVCLCPSAHTGRPWLSISAHISTLVLGLSTLALHVDCLGDFGTHGLSVQYTQDIRGCQPAHTGRSWLSVNTHRTSVAVRVCPSAHTGRPWLSISTHISMLVLGLSTLALPADCSGDFGPRGLSFQYTQDVRRCPSAHTGRPCVSVSTHRTSVCVRQHTQDVRVCPSAHTGRPWLSMSTHISTLVLELSTLTLPVDCSGDFGPRGQSFQYTHDVRRCPSAHTGRPCVSVSTHRTTLALPVDCSGDFSPRGLSFQYTQDVRRCPSPHTGRLWLSISTHTSTFVLELSTLTLPVDCSGDFGPRGLTVQHTGCPWVSVSTHRTSVCVRQHTQNVRGCPTLTLPVDCSGDFGPRGLSVQYTQDVVGCPPHTGTSVAVCTCVSVCVRQHTTGHPWLSISTHISTTHRTSVGVRQHTQDVCGCPCVSVCVRQHTQAVRGCPSAHTRRSCVSGSTHRTSVAVRVCPSEHTGRPWLSISTYISTLILGLSTLALPVDCFGDFGTRGLSIQYTRDVQGCQPAHTGHPWLSVSTHRTFVAVRVCPSAHTGLPWLSISTHISMLVLGLSTLALPMDCAVDFSPRGLFFQYTEDVRRCLSAHTGCPCVSVSTHRTFVCVRQHTQDVRGCPSVHISARWTSVAVRGCPSAQGTSVAVRVCPSVSLSTHTTSVGFRQHTQDVRGCPSAHPGRLWLALCICVCTSAHTGRPWLSISTQISTLVLGLSTLALGLSTLALPVDCLGDFGPRGLSVQYTQDVRGCPPAHMTFVAVRFCLSAHTGHPWLALALPVDCSGDFSPRGLSVQYTQDVRQQHITSVGVCQHTQDVRGCPTHTLPVDCLADFGPHGLSVQYTHEIHGCPSAHTGRPCVSVSRHRTSLAVPVCPSAHTGRPSAHTGRLWQSISRHISTLVLGLNTLALPVDCSGDFSPRGLSVQYTQDVRQHTHDVCGCPSANTGRPWLSVCVRVCPSAHIGRLWLSISTHISTLVLGISTLPVDCSTDFGPRGLSVQYTYDIRGCPSAHTRRLWLSISTQISTLLLGLSTLALPVDCLGDFGPCGLSVQYTQDVRGFPTSVAVRVDRVCPSAHTGRPWLSISTQISTLVLGLSTLALPVDCLGDFGPRGLSVQYTQDVRGCPPAHRTFVAVRGCPSAHTGRPWLSVCVRQHTHDVCGCPSVHISAPCTHWTSVGVCQHTQDVRGCPSAHTRCPWVSVCVHLCLSAHTGHPWLSISTQISTLLLGLSTLALPVDCSSDFGPRGLSIQYTHDVCGCPSAHTGRPCVFVAVRVCPSAHTERMWLSINTHISTLVLGLSTLTLPVDCSGDFGSRGLSVQYTQDVRGCPPAHTGRLCLSVCVRVCPSVSVSTHRTSVAVHQYTYQYVGPWTQH
ncbi:hypothetical protein IGI04_019237 [Brassica rapa subsp. trilocularis]|uniref:Uncharacterized protein n=1 Tax=Brassica rapa subsp. trilocularis TaxID=1813537 RepID=A0ABQ7MGV9_BRACM|nr:hypothetical protein IGI04_019237 [Brassica rapa subsp. trilocularis]